MKTNDSEPTARGLLHWVRTRRWLMIGTPIVLAFLVLGVMIGADRACKIAARDRIFSSVDTIPNRDVGLVLGTGMLTRSGKPNLHFNQRIKAAAALYHAGKVKHLLVSGDNHVKGYDEPSDMRNALIASGIPADAITCDYAGFRTLDSVVRAKTVFGLSRCTIITENFHCPRALWIAGEHGIDAVAYAAQDVNLASWSLHANAREHLARTWCALDLYLLHREPKFPGPREPILLSCNP